MQGSELTIKSFPSQGQMATENVHSTVKGWLNRLVGCWHTEMSRPFSSEGKAYRVCLSCGAHRRFNLRNWEMQGDFYYRLPMSKSLHPINALAAVRRVTA
jgi:hypothetical protein